MNHKLPDEKQETFEEALTSLWDALDEADEPGPRIGVQHWDRVRAAHLREVRAALRQELDEAILMARGAQRNAEGLLAEAEKRIAELEAALDGMKP